MIMGFNDKKIVFNFTDTKEAIAELAKLNKNVPYFISINDEIYKITKIDDIIISVIVDGNVERIKKEADK